MITVNPIHHFNRIYDLHRDQIKEAIRAELTEADHMGKDNSRYYEIVGIVMEGLDKIDKQQSNEATTKGI